MFYKVRARLKKDGATELQRRLLDGVIGRQQPDGQEIVDSMQRAVVTDSGDVEWSRSATASLPFSTSGQRSTTNTSTTSPPSWLRVISGTREDRL